MFGTNQTTGGTSSGSLFGGGANASKPQGTSLFGSNNPISGVRLVLMRIMQTQMGVEGILEIPQVQSSDRKEGQTMGVREGCSALQQEQGQQEDYFQTVEVLLTIFLQLKQQEEV